MNILSKNLLILASAGSGKTFQLGNRVIGLVARGVPPERIVALTFTRKAAGEFADSVLTKLAEAATSSHAATALRQSLALPEADFTETLERVVRALPGFTLGTMDSFFSKIVRGFQYELGLTGGAFDLVEGPRAAALADELLAGILGDMLASERGEQFFHAFRRATIGKEDQGVLNALRAFVGRWQDRYREARDLEWGPAELAGVTPHEWEKQKSGLAATVLLGLDGIEFTDKRQRAAFEQVIENLERHSIGSGSLGSPSSLMKSLLEATATQSGPLTVKFYKEFTIGGPAGAALRSMIELAARCEFAAALARTRAIRDVIALYDNVCARRLRKRGILGFNDVKLLMGEWALNEDARLRREAVDFRLDARFDHWLLDEFQDTSRADWTGLLPLIDEAATDPASSMFIVGDRKQAIYAWRGGDHTLFDEVSERYGSGLEIASMAESWRSCPEVLALVNQVCGDRTTLRELFGEAAAKWTWEDHFPAAFLTQSAKRGQARVGLVANREERMARLVEILRELGVGERAMSCGILLRNNHQVQEIAEHLRAHGFDVIEDGQRQPAKDNPAGIAISHLLQWLVSPSDNFARKVVEMSPLNRILQKRYGESWWRIWEQLTDLAAATGFANMIGTLLYECWDEFSDYGQRRAGDLMAALSALDSQGADSPKTAMDWIERLEIPQSPGDAAIQVMTIHKSKGLGFDVVILPEIPNENIPQVQYFDVAESVSWLTETPPKWARAILPDLNHAESLWAANQRYEAFCMLYVALTRAKRGLYVLMESPSDSSAPDKSSLTNWLLRSTGSEERGGAIYEIGPSNWSLSVARLEPTPSPPPPLAPGYPIPRRRLLVPSGTKPAGPSRTLRAHNKNLGAEIHSVLERVSWVDEIEPEIPKSDAGAIVSSLLRNPALTDVFYKNGRTIKIYREQASDAVTNGNFLTGVIDRLHLHCDDKGTVNKIEIYDFKSDAFENPADLVNRYSAQMNAYRAVLGRLYPGVEIVCALLSTRQGTLIPV